MTVEKNKDGEARPPESGDVQDLVSRLQLDGLQYRDFSVRRPAVLELAGGRAVAPSRVAVAAPPSAVEAPPAIAVRPTEPPKLGFPEPAVAAKVLAASVTSAFERLRRQTVGSRGDTAVLSLRLTARPAVSAKRQTLLHAPLSQAFARLASATSPPAGP